MQEGYNRVLDQLKRDGTITRWHLAQPDYNRVVVALEFDRETVYQVASALANRGDARNGLASWAANARRFDTLRKHLDRIHDDPGWPAAKHRVAVQFEDGYVEVTEFVALADATFHAHSTSTNQRVMITRLHGAVTGVKIEPVEP